MMFSVLHESDGGRSMDAVKTKEAENVSISR